MRSTADTTFANTARRGISRRVVALLKDFVGRGPTNARTFFDEQLVLVVLEDTLTKGERTLAEDDRIELVRELRRGFLGAMGEEIKSVVEEETGRQVATFLSDYSVLPDYAIKAFILEPHPLQEDRVAGAENAANDGGPRLPIASNDGAAPERREQQATISRELIAILKELVGRGPTMARTYVHDGVVASLLGDTLTKAERTLARENEADRVREIRRELQDVFAEEAVKLVQSQLGRPVKAFLSDHSVFPDYAIEVFLLGDSEGEAERQRNG